MDMENFIGSKIDTALLSVACDYVAMGRVSEEGSID